MEHGFDTAFYRAVLDRIQSNIYITDPETDTIVYMNGHMKQTFGLKDAEGRVCWKTLQKGMTGRCPFCKIGRLEGMKKGAILLNVGRGNAVETEALCDLLESGYLGGAGLDVTDPEPLPAGHRLWKAPNLVLTPHISGLYHLQETHERILRIAAENLRAFLAGEPLKNVVDWETGYRSV